MADDADEGVRKSDSPYDNHFKRDHTTGEPRPRLSTDAGKHNIYISSDEMRYENEWEASTACRRLEKAWMKYIEKIDGFQPDV